LLEEWNVSRDRYLQLDGLAFSIEQKLNRLADYGKDEGGGTTRLLYSSTWIQAQEAIKKWMQEAGLQVYSDPVGNVFGRLQGKDPSQGTILTGSHIDTVKNGGKYDGAYGIVAGIMALEHILKHQERPACNLEVVSLAEEEGSRFPTTFWGSRNITGQAMSYADAKTVHDADGISLFQGMRSCGYGQEEQHACVRQDLKAFIEDKLQNEITTNDKVI
jgi:allantoate deiminase